MFFRYTQLPYALCMQFPTPLSLESDPDEWLLTSSVMGKPLSPISLPFSPAYASKTTQTYQKWYNDLPDRKKEDDWDDCLSMYTFHTPYGMVWPFVPTGRQLWQMLIACMTSLELDPKVLLLNVFNGSTLGWYSKLFLCYTTLNAHREILLLWKSSNPPTVSSWHTIINNILPIYSTSEAYLSQKKLS